MPFSKEALLPPNEVRRLFFLDQEGRICWRSRPGLTKSERFFNTRWAGKIAGSVGKDGYSRTHITIDGVKYLYLTHRLIYVLEKGCWPPTGVTVDHQNGKRDWNHPENLRDALGCGNAQNRRLNVNNTSGFKGVKLRHRSGEYEVYIGVNRRRIFVGTFADPAEAARAYDVAALRHHGAFARTNASLGLL